VRDDVPPPKALDIFAELFFQFEETGVESLVLLFHMNLAMIPGDQASIFDWTL
jgi:hypothetical protein